MTTLDVALASSIGRGLTNNSQQLLLLDRSGAAVVMDFFMKSILDGHGYQVRAGTVTTPLTGDVLITDTAAEFCADAAAGFVIMPTKFQVDIEALGGTLPQVALKSAATVSSAGAAFVPLPLLRGGAAAATTARVAAAGGVTVTAELATTTVVHYIRTMAVAGDVQAAWEPVAPPVINGAGCVYAQVGSVATGSTYFGHLNYLEFTSSQLGL